MADPQPICDDSLPPVNHPPLSIPTPTPATTSSSLITLQVGSSRFITTATTLSGSPVLAAKINNNWVSSERQPNGSYHLDADPDTFAHVLRFLRDGIYPLAYDARSGHDFVLYAAVRQLADFLLVEKLVVWLREKRYLKAVCVETSAKVVEQDNEYLGFGVGEIDDAGTKTMYYPSWRTVQRYMCPVGNQAHNGHPVRCGRHCRRAQRGGADRYEDCLIMSTLVLKEKVVFDERVCVEEW